MQSTPMLLHDASSDSPELTASVAHELRTPLTSVLAQVETLLEGIYGRVTGPQASALNSIQDHVHQALGLVTDLVELRALDISAPPPSPTTCCLEEVCTRCLDTVSAFARSRSVSIHHHISPSGAQVEAHEPQLQRIITELLSAAISTTHTGTQVHLSLSTDSSGLVIHSCGDGSVTSNGSSIQPMPPPATSSEHILGQLQQLKPIGMALLRGLLQLHGGTLTASRDAKHAVHLVIHLPLQILTTDKVSAAPRDSTGGEPSPTPSFRSKPPVILLADDQPDLLAVARNYLESHGFVVITARDGREALRLICTEQPDLVLMDVRMPVLDGLQALHELRQLTDARFRDIPVISLSGIVGGNDKEQCLSAGANAYLNKPFGLKELDRAIAAFLPPPPPVS
ncbi:MAG: hybrid sensor histidine kinase/response regulator [Verrucomicrobiaceae bacterium]